MNNELSVSFVRIEQFLYDGHRVVTEVNLQFVDQRDVSVILKFKERTLALDDYPGFQEGMRQLSLIDKVHFILTFVEKSTICTGFNCELSCDAPLSPDLYVKHSVQDCKDQLAISYTRFFSSSCLVLKSSLGVSCANCKQAKKQLDRIKNRRESSTATNIRCNHRYLSREEILDKLIEEKKKAINLRKVNERLEKEMVDMEPNDHADLVQMMSNIESKDVPESLLTLWELQTKIAATTSSRGYRWHPK